jgi:hypothetical protein
LTATVEIGGPFKVKTEPYTITITEAVASRAPAKKNWAAVLLVLVVVVVVILLGGRKKETAA